MALHKKAKALVQAVKALLTEKRAVATKERELVKSLNSVLTKIGYEVHRVPGAKEPKLRGRPPKTRTEG